MIFLRTVASNLTLENAGVIAFLLFFLFAPLIPKIQIKAGLYQEGIYLEPPLFFLVLAIFFFLLAFWGKNNPDFWKNVRNFLVPYPIAKIFYLLFLVLFLSWIYGVFLTGNTAWGDLLHLIKYGLYFLLFPLAIRSAQVLGDRKVIIVLFLFFLVGVIISIISLARIYQFVEAGGILDFWVYSPQSRSVGFLGQYLSLADFSLDQIPKAAHATFGLYLAVILGAGLVFLFRARLISFQLVGFLSGIGVVFAALLYTLSRGAVAAGIFVLLGGSILLWIRRRFLVLGLLAALLFMESAVLFQLNPEIHQKFASTFPGAQKATESFTEISAPIGVGIINAFEGAREAILIFSGSKPKQIAASPNKEPERFSYTELSLDESSSERVKMWQNTLKLLVSDPHIFIFGVGYSTDNLRYYTGGKVTYTHSLFLDLWVRGGLLSLALVLVIWTLIFFKTAQLWFSQNSLVRAFSFALFWFLLGWFLDNAISGEQFFSDAPMLAFWGVFGLVLGLAESRLVKHKPLRILMVCTTSEVGGGPEHVWQLVNRLDKNKFEVVLAVPNNGPYFHKFKDIRGIEVVDLPIRSVNPKLIYDLWKLGRRNNIDLIHSHGKGAGIYSRPVGLLLGKPTIHTFHGIHYRAYHQVFRPIYLFFEKILGFFTTRFINVSKGERDLAVNLGIYSQDKSTVIYNGVTIPELQDKAPLRKKLGLSGRILINVARFDVPKGHEFLISALPKILDVIPEAKLVMLGDGKRMAQMKDLANKLNIGRYCNFSGFKPNVSEYLQASDLFVSSSLWEGLPISLLEAMSVRLPVVATNVVGNNEIVEDKKTGLLAEPQNSGDLADKVILMLKDEKLRQRVSNSGYELVKTKFSLDEMVRKTESLYQEVLNEDSH